MWSNKIKKELIKDDEYQSPVQGKGPTFLSPGQAPYLYGRVRRA
jgi:hypothetical protein